MEGYQIKNGLEMGGIYRGQSCRGGIRAGGGASIYNGGLREGSEWGWMWGPSDKLKWKGKTTCLSMEVGMGRATFTDPNKTPHLLFFLLF